MNVVEHLESLGTCEDALIYAEGMTAQQAWDTCPVVEWHIWWMLVLDYTKAPAILELLREKLEDAIMHHRPEFNRGNLQVLMSNPAISLTAWERQLYDIPEVLSAAIELKHARDTPLSNDDNIKKICAGARYLTDQPGGDSLVDRVRAAYPNPPWTES